jgi:glycosyltransferase involved in cell wall biosynthesis
MSSQHVVLDARITRQMSVGMIAYVRELVQRLPAAAPDLRFTVVSNAALAPPDGVEVVHVDERLAVNGSIGEQFGFGGVLRRAMAGDGLVHLMSMYAPRVAPRPYVHTIHDLIHRRFPQYFKWKVKAYYALVVDPVARRAEAVITDAKATIPDLQRFMGVQPERVRVVPLGVDSRFALDAAAREQRSAAVRARYGLDRPYVLYAGNHREHKNLETLAAAGQRVGQPCDLVLTEAYPFSFELDRYGKSDGRIVRPGHVSDEELVGLYAGCVATVQPSLYEGFGLGVLEGMAAGAPVIVAQSPALLEVAGDAAMTFPPRDSDALTRALAQALAGGPEVEALRARARSRAAAFSWDETARRTAEVYRKCLPR